jgi:hypothetical protein
VTVYGYTPIIQSSEASASIALNKITAEIANGNYIPLGAVIVATNHSHGREYPGSNWSEFFSDSDLGNVTKDTSISVVTPTGKVYQYNDDKSLYYYGNVNIGQSINSNNFDIKTEKFINKDIKLDSNRLPIKDLNGGYLKIEVEYEKVIVTPINKK